MRVLSLFLAASAMFLPAFQAGAADVAYCVIVKLQEFVQTDPVTLVVPPTSGFAFDTFVVASSSNAVMSASLQTPNNGALNLPPQPGGTTLLFEQRFDTKNALDVNYPSGTSFSPASYQMTMFGLNDGGRIIPLAFGVFGALGSYPAAPQISNFDAAQSVNATAAFTPAWTLSGGQLSDIVQLTVYDAASNTVYASPLPFTAGALNGTSNSIVIPANTLPAGATLQAQLEVGRPVDANTNSYPGAIGAGLLGMVVQFPIVTVPAASPTRVTIIPSKPPLCRLQITGQTNHNYHLLVTTNFLTWQELLVTNPPTGTCVVTDSVPAGVSKRFYRVKVGP